MAGNKTLDYMTCQFDQERQFSWKKSQAEIWIPFLPTSPGNTVTAYPLTWQSKPCSAPHSLVHLYSKHLCHHAAFADIYWYFLCLCEEQKSFHFIESSMFSGISATTQANIWLTGKLVVFIILFKTIEKKNISMN